MAIGKEPVSGAVPKVASVVSLDEIVSKAKRASFATLDPFLKIATSGPNLVGQFRVKWLRRTLVILWCLAAFCAIAMIGVDLLALSVTQTSFNERQNALLDLVLSFVRSFGLTSFIFDLWVIVALAHLSTVWGLRTQGDRAKAPLWKIYIAVSIIVGRVSSIPGTLLLSSIPDSWWLLWPIKYGLIPPIALIIAGSVDLFTLYMAFTLFILTAILLPCKIFEATAKISNAVFITKAQSASFFGTILAFWYWFTGNELPQREEIPDDSKGARFAIPREIETLRASDGQGHMAFGHVHGVPLFLKTEKHILLMASTRSGKGTSLIIPHLLRYPGSAFVLDPKGENARATGRQRKAFNDKVLYLDPFGISGKPQARFNPFSRFTAANMEAESKALAAALVMGESGKRDHWTASAQQLLAAIILFVVSHPSLPPKSKSLVLVRHWLLKNINELLERMTESNAEGGLVSRLALSFLQTPEKEFGSILSTAQRETEILDNPFIAACLSGSGPGEEVNFADWHKGTMSVFLCLSAPKFPVFNRWLRLVLTSALDEMTDQLNPPPLPVCFMLDELATLGHLQAVENAVGLAAGYGIQLVSVFQDVAQMKDLYKGRWASFIGNAGVRALFALDDYDTAHYWSQFMGGHLIEARSEQQDIYGLTHGQSKSERQQPLLSPEEIMLAFAQEKMLVLPQGFRPILSDRVPYYQDQTLEGLWDDPRAVHNAEPIKSKTILCPCGSGKTYETCCGKKRA